MKVQVIAKIEMPVYVATDSHGVCLVLSLEDTRVIALGDVLNGDFDAPGPPALTVDDVTQGHPVRVRLEDWGLTREQALHRLRQLGASSMVWTLDPDHPPDPVTPGRHGETAA